MKLYYYKSALGNFGDDLNAWIWDRLLPNFFDNDDNTRFSGIGTIINTEMPDANKWIVFGSGIGYGHPPKGFGGNKWDIVSVRGPLSAQILGLGKEKYITDGAALLNTLSEFTPCAENERSGTIFIPHHNALDKGPWERGCQRANVEFVNPRGEATEIIQKIRRSRLVLADAMHAAIIADAMRVPWVPMVTSSQINTFKWLDWTQTISCPYMPIVVGSNFLQNVLHNRKVNLYGEKNFHPGEDVDEALKTFKKQQNLTDSVEGHKYINKVKSLYYRLPNKLFCLYESQVSKNRGERAIEYVTSRLLEATRNGGFLSEQNVFDENLDRLLNGINAVKNRYSK
ncbi:polysaccharide pyruvyl transferase family protein [Acerihabitans arboris]|uniref:Polysaccharide pyruvyl transferase domain-containing protein n=1 Tax=Acerihabitans arboris TaxID=2691583 RepID=A0A845SM35_9GAMM|nr:polysaccharide pyruvyl transferase family protein [Acerihabitans arboris]NDL62325.1 hypothetical protein [Acerihabitans arboris]